MMDSSPDMKAKRVKQLPPGPAMHSTKLEHVLSIAKKSAEGVDKRSRLNRAAKAARVFS